MKARRTCSVRELNCSSRKSLVVLACFPMGLAVLGALLDERRALGFTIWRAACRGSGVTPGSLVAFTLELLPTAVIGALLGGLVVLAGGAADHARDARGALAVHIGCVIAMPLALLLCASALPISVTLVMEIAIAAAATLLAERALRPHP